jgi:two-component system phosphate regulon response regulator PhoB
VLVEDHAAVRQLYAIALRARGWSVVERPSAAGLLQLLREKPVEAVVIDWTLPGQSGFEALWAIKRDPQLRHIRVLVLTAHYASAEKARALAVGAEHFLEKPLHPELLADVLERRGGRPAPTQSPR